MRTMFVKSLKWPKINNNKIYSRNGYWYAENGTTIQMNRNEHTIFSAKKRERDRDKAILRESCQQHVYKRANTTQ